MGEPLSEPIHYRNAQWAVTSFGIEQIPPAPGPIEANVIAEKRRDGDGNITYYNFPLHMAGKEWVKIDLFLEAFAWALVFHKEASGEEPSLELFLKSAARAREISKRHSKPE